MPNRTPAQRKADLIRRLENEPSIWIATGDATGKPHLIPLSLFWDGERIVVTTPTDSRTVRNIAASGKARASLGDTEDVAIVDASVELLDLADVSAELLDAFVKRAGWNPTAEDGDWSFLFLTPVRIQSWNSVAEIQGRTVMSAGRWLDE